VAHVHIGPDVNLKHSDIYEIFSTDTEFGYSGTNISLSMIGELSIRNSNYYRLKAYKYFYFELEFDSYTYQSFYDADIGNFIKRITRKNYSVNLCANLKRILNCKNAERIRDIMELFNTLFICMQLQNILSKKNYLVHNIKEFIIMRESMPMYFDKWHCFRMNDEYLFDMQTKKIVTQNKIFFSRKGGIIETNNVERLVRLCFGQCPNTLIILPQYLSHLWPSHPKITFGEILKGEIRLPKKHYDRVIIHESHWRILSAVKYIARIARPQIIWVLNSFRLPYYLKQEKIDLNHVLEITNLWLCFDNKQKKIYKKELLQMGFADLNKYYAKYLYEEDHNLLKFNRLNLFDKLNQVEIHIYEKLKFHYLNWKKRLSCSPNIYSTSTPKQFQKIKSAMLKTYFGLITHIVPKSEVQPLLLLICPKPALHIYFNEDNTCPICYDSTNLFQSVLPCGHQFCLDCALESKIRTAGCPICRESYTLQQIAIFRNDDPDKDFPNSVMSFLKEIISESALISDIDPFKFASKNNEFGHLYFLNGSPDGRTDQIMNFYKIINRDLVVSHLELNFE
jgi:hypothetical protein